MNSYTDLDDLFAEYVIYKKQVLMIHDLINSYDKNLTLNEVYNRAASKLKEAAAAINESIIIKN